MKKTAAKKGNPELIEALNAIEKEKDISKEILLEAIENSLVAACKNEYGKADNIRVNLLTQIIYPPQNTVLSKRNLR